MGGCTYQKLIGSKMSDGEGSLGVLKEIRGKI
jgi:hypothetical protein